ncbi:hypothetical protein [Dapis sp. BLCC M229]|uniref:hypothetical protein n=1 Tax=Dapis sp. BLCC M229 TaxID=3400188 RepID=UPI003CE67BDA
MRGQPAEELRLGSNPSAGAAGQDVKGVRLVLGVLLGDMKPVGLGSTIATQAVYLKSNNYSAIVELIINHTQK